jgi:hypothetical protein
MEPLLSSETLAAMYQSTRCSIVGALTVHSQPPCLTDFSKTVQVTRALVYTQTIFLFDMLPLVCVQIISSALFSKYPKHITIKTFVSRVVFYSLLRTFGFICVCVLMNARHRDPRWSGLWQRTVTFEFDRWLSVLSVLVEFRGRMVQEREL